MSAIQTQITSREEWDNILERLENETTVKISFELNDSSQPTNLKTKFTTKTDSLYLTFDSRVILEEESILGWNKTAFEPKRIKIVSNEAFLSYIKKVLPRSDCSLTCKSTGNVVQKERKQTKYLLVDGPTIVTTTESLQEIENIAKSYLANKLKNVGNSGKIKICKEIEIIELSYLVEVI